MDNWLAGLFAVLLSVFAPHPTQATAPTQPPTPAPVTAHAAPSPAVTPTMAECEGCSTPWQSDQPRQTVNESNCRILEIFVLPETTTTGGSRKFDICDPYQSQGKPPYTTWACSEYHDDGSWTNTAYSGDTTATTCGDGFVEQIDSNALGSGQSQP